MADGPLCVGAASRPFIGEEINGDAYLVEHRGERHCIAVIDGLGHGPVAAEAAQAAIEAIRACTDVAPEDCLDACRAPLRRTRGAAVSVVTIDHVRGTLAFAGIGNVEARLLTSERERRIVPQRGIVGTFERRLRVLEVELPARWLLAVYSDGISGRFELESMDESWLTGPPEALASRLLEGWGREQDDATVVIVRSRG